MNNQLSIFYVPKTSDYYVVFTPNDKGKYTYKRFFVSINQLHNYIGQKNANKCILNALKLQVNKTTLKFRKFGKIEIYLK